MTNPKDRPPLVELHSHLGASVAASVLWSIAHDQGIKLPTKDYWAFEQMVVIKKPLGKKSGVGLLDAKYYKLTELIQSSPIALAPAVRRVIGGAYRRNNIVLHELRFNPAKRNRGGERDLDYIILAVLEGLERATLEYPPVKAGVIIEFDRTFPRSLNETLYRKALKYQPRGVMGIDIAGPQHPAFQMADYIDIYSDAAKHGLGTTVHTGEEGSLTELNLVVSKLKPMRIGHGLLAAKDKALMAELKARRTVLELCPTSNLNIGIFQSWAELKAAYQTLFKAGVTLTINTDGPEMHGTNLTREFRLLEANGVFDAQETEIIKKNAFGASFLKPDKTPAG